MTDHSAAFGHAYLVEIEWNTHADGSEVNFETDAIPRTLHGPFDTSEEATEWLETYPDDTDVHEMSVLIINRVKGD